MPGPVYQRACPAVDLAVVALAGPVLGNLLRVGSPVDFRVRDFENDEDAENEVEKKERRNKVERVFGVVEEVVDSGSEGTEGGRHWGGEL